MKIIIKFIPILLLLVSCKNQVETNHEKKSYLRHVGDIQNDPSLDDTSFQLCNGDEYVLQHFNLSTTFLEYEGEKNAIIEVFEKNYNPEKVKKESGLIRIRFIVNCEGDTGRFRILGMDKSYKQKEFDPSITDQILSIIKSLTGWKTKTSNGGSYDYYQYLIFKIDKGQIKEILP